MPLDITFVFTANPEDYTNRGAIITPLKDRIESQILTHYPKDLETSRRITRQEARTHPDQGSSGQTGRYCRRTGRGHCHGSPQKRIRGPEKWRVCLHDHHRTGKPCKCCRKKSIKAWRITYLGAYVRFLGRHPSITGKVELVYEGEQEGPFIVALNLIGKAVRNRFPSYFPAPESGRKPLGKGREEGADIPADYASVVDWFNSGHQLDLLHDLPETEYRKALDKVTGLSDLVSNYYPQVSPDEHYFLMEFVLHGLAEYSRLNKQILQHATVFGDLLSAMFQSDDSEDWEERRR